MENQTSQGSASAQAQEQSTEQAGEVQPTFPELAPNPEIIPPAQNELDTKTENSASTGIGEKIRNAGTVILDACGVPFKRGKGRPRKDGQPNKASIPLAAVPAGSVVETPEPAPLPAPIVCGPEVDSLFRDALVSGSEGAKELALEIIRDKAEQAGIDRAFIEQALSKANNPKVSADFSKSLELVCRKYSVKTEYAPEIALAINAGRMAAPFWFLFRTFNREIERRQREERKAAQNGR